jgi:hypothetical protein
VVALDLIGGDRVDVGDEGLVPPVRPRVRLAWVG